MRPLIGIPCRTIPTEEGLIRYGGLSTYTRAIEMAGGAPILIPLMLGDETLRAIYARLDGLLLAGGVDIHPKEYGESVESFCGEIDEARDQTELRLTRQALAEARPILAICRGIQTLNVAAGGSLYQDLQAQIPGVNHHAYYPHYPFNLIAHEIEVDPGSRLARAFGVSRIGVNSLHHQAVKRIGQGLRVIAKSPDGIVEGLEGTNDAWVVGVQFHPEWLVDDDVRMVRLFEEFVKASGG